MKLSTRTRYGMRAIIEIALAYGGKPLQIKVIAKRQNISNKYLEQLVAIMKSAGLVHSIRGPHGGYVLAKAPKDVKLIDVFLVLEGPVLTVECVEHSNFCSSCADCITRKIWTEINDAIISTLASRTLAELVKMAGADKKNVNYHI
ncbi:MAG: Rrf2 family transcriptional regulator [Anaerohalosphaeraceae bacterium]|nr:Rrf2 family transcriptional regulator [Anaerohalosphaeraceae bacterium]